MRRRIFNKFTALLLVVVMALVFAGPVSLYASSGNLPAAESDMPAAATLPPAEEAPTARPVSKEANAPPDQTPPADAGEEAETLAPQEAPPEAAEPETAPSTDTETEPEQPAQHEDAPALFTVSFHDAEGNLLHQTQAEPGAAVPAQADPAAPEGMQFKGWYEENATEAFRFEGSVVSGDVKLYAAFEAIPAQPEATVQEPEAEAIVEVAADNPAEEVATEEAPVLAPEEADDDALLPVAEQGVVAHTVTFQVDDGVYHTDTVLDETLVSLPAAPTGQNGKRFVGWYTEGGLPFSHTQLITEDLTLVAVFDDATVLVTYLDTDGAVLDVREGTVGEAAPQPTRQPTLGMGRALLHWALAGTQEAFIAPLSENITLVPVLEDISLAVFVTNGSEVEPQTGTKGFLATAPANDPTRDGYTFDGWAADEDGTVDFNFVTPIEGTVFIYAKWVPAEADYTVNIWVEKPDVAIPGDPLAGGRGDYDLHCTTTLKGKTGDKVRLDDTAARNAAATAPADVKNLLTYSTYKTSEEQTISPNGDTVVNVFFTRTVFTFTFDTTALGGEIFTEGGSVGSKYSIDVKLEQNVTALWPVKVTLSKTNNVFVNWSGFYGNSSQRVSYSHISVAFSAPTAMQGNWWYNITTPRRTSVTLTPTTTANPYTETRHYYLELTEAEKQAYLENGLPSETVREWMVASHAKYAGTRYYKLVYQSTTNNQKASPATSARGWPGRDFEGFETIGSTSGDCRTAQFQEIVLNSGKDYTLNYFMPRKSSTLTLKTGGGSIQNPDSRLSADGGAYTATLQYQQPLDEILPSDVTLANHAFEGWYLDEHFSARYTGGTMPGNALTLYAKYRGTEVSVSYTDGDAVATRTYSRGEKLNAHELDGTPYSGAQPGDVIPGKGIFNGWYYDVGTGQKATVAFPLGLALTRDSYTLTAELTPQTYTVTYAGDEGGEAPVAYTTQQVTSGSNNTLARSGYPRFVPPAREGYAFKGWCSTQGGSVANFTTATRILESTTVYAIWEAIPVTLTYDANGGVTTPDVLQQVLNYGQSLDDAALEMPGADSVARDNHTFLGWFTQPQGGQPYSTATRLTKDTTVYAHWKAIVVDPAGPDPDPTPVDPTPDPEPDPDPVDPVDPVEPTPDPEPIDPTPDPEVETPAKPDPAPAKPNAPKTRPDTVTSETPTPEPNLALEATPTVVEGVIVPATVPANTAAPAVPQKVQEQLDSQSGNIAKDIMDDNVPLGSPEFGGAWSLLSLMMALAGAVISVVVFATMLARRRRKADETAEAGDEDAQPRKQRSLLLKALAIVLGLLAGLLFLVLDDLSLPMVFVNQWTLWVAVPFILHVAVLVAQVFIKRKPANDDMDDVIEKA